MGCSSLQWVEISRNDTLKFQNKQTQKQTKQTKEREEKRRGTLTKNPFSNITIDVFYISFAH